LFSFSFLLLLLLFWRWWLLGMGRWHERECMAHQPSMLSGLQAQTVDVPAGDRAHTEEHHGQRATHDTHTTAHGRQAHYAPSFASSLLGLVIERIEVRNVLRHPEAFDAAVPRDVMHPRHHLSVHRLVPRPLNLPAQ
jgi:hypothetical protein